MEEREAKAGLDLLKEKKKSTKKKAKVEVSPFEASDLEGLKLRNHSEVRCSPYFQKKLSVPGDGGLKSEEKKKNAVDVEEEKEPLLTEKKIMLVEDEEEEEGEKEKPRSQCLANFAEVCSRYAFKGSCEMFRRNGGLGFSHVRKPAFYNTPKTMSHSQVRKVSPYFQSTPKPMSPSQVRKVSPYFQNSTARQLKRSTKVNKNVSPYFCRQRKIAKTDTRRPLKKKAPTLTAAQKKDVAYERKRPDNTWNPPPAPFRLLQHDHVHDPWRVLVICMLLNRTKGLQVFFL